MKKLGLVKAGTLQPFLRFLRQNEVDLAPHFQAATLPESMVNEENAWLPKVQVYKFLSDIAATHDLEALGLIVGDQICVADLGTLGEQIYACETLEEACQTFARLVPEFAEGNSSALEVHGKQAWFYYQTSDHRKGNRDYADHYGMMMLLSVVRLIGGSNWYPAEVRIQTGASSAFSDHPAWSKTRVEYNAGASGFAFPSAWLQKNIPRPPSAKTEKPPYPSDPPASLTKSLEIILAAYINLGGMPSQTKVADSLSMSERSLKRLLANEDTCYSEIVDRVRLSGAKKLLKQPDTSIKEIAYILGYSGSNNFIRAFQRMTGTTPARWRAEQHSA